MTIHQPSIDIFFTACECSMAFWLRASRPCKIYIFEAFDALVLLQRGGKARPALSCFFII